MRTCQNDEILKSAPIRDRRTSATQITSQKHTMHKYKTYSDTQIVIEQTQAFMNFRARFNNKYSTHNNVNTTNIHQHQINKKYK
jgi:hypothetical protein